jgi:hypothetical protein
MCCQSYTPLLTIVDDVVINACYSSKYALNEFLCVFFCSLFEP